MAPGKDLRSIAGATGGLTLLRHRGMAVLVHGGHHELKSESSRLRSYAGTRQRVCAGSVCHGKLRSIAAEQCCAVNRARSIYLLANELPCAPFI